MKPRGWILSESRSSEMALVGAGQCGSGPVRAARWLSSAKLGIVSSGWGCSQALDMLPCAAAVSPGMRPRSIRLATSEVMKTVLPARAKPVTPSRITRLQEGLRQRRAGLFDALHDSIRYSSDNQRTLVSLLQAYIWGGSGAA